MTKKFENFSFNKLSLDEFKEDVDKINNMFDELMKDKKIKKIYKKMQKLEEKDIKKISYNHINYDSGFDLKIMKNKKIKLNNNSKIDDYADKNTGVIFG